MRLWMSQYDTLYFACKTFFSWLSVSVDFVPENCSALCIKLYTQVVSIDLECDNIGEHNCRPKQRILHPRTIIYIFCLGIIRD